MSDKERQLYCGNLSEKVTEDILYELFLQLAMSNPVIILVTSIALLDVFLKTSAYSDAFYTAAVFEHNVRYNYSPGENVVINLAYYRNAAKAAKNKGADMIVFPEYGILAVIRDREKLKKNAEFIPNPKHVRTNPCVSIDQYSSRPILRSLSCIARDYSLVVVANTAHVEPCQKATGCPADGNLFHNTNVAFDSDGTLIGRYHKERLFYEPSMDLPAEKQHPIFSTKFGKFGMFASFDILFKRMTEVAKEKVEAILLPAVWIDTAPYMLSVQMWQWWAIGNNVTFMAANVHHPGHTTVGSGIFTAKGVPLKYTHNPDANSKLIVAKIPRSRSANQHYVAESSVQVISLDGSEENYEDEGNKVPETCSLRGLGESTDYFSDFRCFEEDTSNYTFVKLTKPVGHAEACNNGVCCSVRYSADKMLENYYLGVFNGTYSLNGRYFWCHQNCLLVRCDAMDNNTCGTFPIRSKTRFSRVYLTSNITTEYVYPTILASGIRLIPFSDWQHGVRPGKTYVNYDNDMGKKLLVVGMHGRCYSKDPPYIR